MAVVHPHHCPAWLRGGWHWTGAPGWSSNTTADWLIARVRAHYGDCFKYGNLSNCQCACICCTCSDLASCIALSLLTTHDVEIELHRDGHWSIFTLFSLRSGVTSQVHRSSMSLIQCATRHYQCRPHNISVGRSCLYGTQQHNPIIVWRLTSYGHKNRNSGFKT